MKDMLNKIILGDCMDVMKGIPDNSVDCIITDCPYHIVSGGCSTGAYGNMSGCLSRGKGQTNIQNMKKGTIFNENDIKFQNWLPETYRVLKDNSHCYIMINGRNLAELQKQAEKVGFVFQQLLVWNKGNSTPNRYYLNSCEFILMFRKGMAKNINNMGTKNILDIRNIIGNKIHPTEKPIDLMRIMIENSTKKNEIVLDQFIGVGSTAIACIASNRQFIGIEKDPEYHRLACERVEKEQNNLFNTLQ